MPHTLVPEGYERRDELITLTNQQRVSRKSAQTFMNQQGEIDRETNAV
jgi:hypothetical protein